MNVINAKVTLPQGSSLKKTASVVKEIEIIVDKIPEVKSYLSYIGKDGVEKASVTINLIQKEKRKRSVFDIINSIIPGVAKIPDAEVVFNTSPMGGDMMQGDITVNVYGIHYDEILSFSNEMLEIMKSSGFFRTVNSSHKPTGEEIRFIPDNDRVIRHGLKNSKISSTIRSSVAGNDNNIYKEKGEEYKINVHLSDDFTKNIQDIRNIGIISKDGLIPVSELGKISFEKAFPKIMRRDKVRIIQLNGFLAKSTAGQVRKILDQKFSKIKFKPEYGYRHAGKAEIFGEASSEIIKAFILAVILTYMLLVAILNSFTNPFVIVTSVATSFIGVFLFLFFAGYTINIASMMAMVMLVGIAVNNAIFILFPIKHPAASSEVFTTRNSRWPSASFRPRRTENEPVEIKKGLSSFKIRFQRGREH